MGLCLCTNDTVSRVWRLENVLHQVKRFKQVILSHDFVTTEIRTGYGVSTQRLPKVTMPMCIMAAPCKRSRSNIHVHGVSILGVTALRQGWHF